MTNVAQGRRIAADQPVLVKGIAWDGGYGIRTVEVSVDEGRSWQSAELGENHGKYSFRTWQFTHAPRVAGRISVMARASNAQGSSQPSELIFNGPGYHNNVVQKIVIDIV
jgi:hypothetical protein